VLKQLERALKAASSSIQSGTDLQTPGHVPKFLSINAIMASMQVDSVVTDQLLNGLQSAGMFRAVCTITFKMS